MEKQRIAVAYGDGIGPEIMDATIKILNAANAPLEYDVIEVGEKVYLSGINSGISNESWDIIRKNKILLKAPITTPQGGGYKSLNVTIRKTLGLFANVRPCIAYSPYVKTNFPNMDLTIIRENEEDLYAGIEHRQTSEVFQCLKLLSTSGTENIIRYAFEYARTNNRKKVTCMTKDNIMKISDGMFHKMFNDIAKEYPQIESDHMIIDIGSAKLASDPERFDVIVTLNLYGDIISDIAADVAGSVGLGGSSNVGKEYAMFEAIHGSAPDIAGKGIANPSGLINGAIMMLVHLCQNEIASNIMNAWLKTLEDGIHTGDIYNEKISKKRASTAEFADAVIERLGQKPSQRPAIDLGEATECIVITSKNSTVKPVKELVGTDIFLDWSESNKNPNVLGEIVTKANTEKLNLTLISNRGMKVYPNGSESTFCTDHWRCRFTPVNNSKLNSHDLIQLQNRVLDLGLDIVKTENLYSFDGVKGYSMGQGE
jgi:isocitrate dehydrogenase